MHIQRRDDAASRRSCSQRILRPSSPDRRTHPSPSTDPPRDVLSKSGNSRRQRSLLRSKDARRRRPAMKRRMATTSPYLITPEVAARLRCSVRTVHELTRLGRIPHRRLPRSLRCLFLENELTAWESGAALEAFELAERGRLCVRPRRLSTRAIRRRANPVPTPLSHRRQGTNSRVLRARPIPTLQ
jgi:hypothetical protein